MYICMNLYLPFVDRLGLVNYRKGIRRTTTRRNLEGTQRRRRTINVSNKLLENGKGRNYDKGLR